MSTHAFAVLVASIVSADNPQPVDVVIATPTPGTYAVFAKTGGVEVSFDGSRIAFPMFANVLFGDSTNLMTVGSDGAMPYVVVNQATLNGTSFYPSLSDDGSRVAFLFGLWVPLKYGEFLISAHPVAALSDGSSHQVLANAVLSDTVALTGDGQTVFYFAATGLFEGGGIWKVPFDVSSPPVEVVPNLASIEVSKDGSTFAWGGIGADGKSRVFLSKSDGSDVQQVPPVGNLQDIAPSLSADGKVVVFSAWDLIASPNFAGSVVAYRPDTKEFTPLITWPVPNGFVLMNHPVVSGDGEFAVVTMGEVFPGSPGDIYRLGTDGSLPEIAGATVATTTKLAIDGNGSRIVVLDGGTLNVIDYNLPNVKIRNAPLPGGTVTLIVSGHVGDPFTLFVSLLPATIAVPPFGVLGVDPAHLVVLATGTLGDPARFELSCPLEADPALVGVDGYAQALVGGGQGNGPAKLTNTLQVEVLGKDPYAP